MLNKGLRAELQKQAILNIKNNLQGRVLKVMIASTELVNNRVDVHLIYAELRQLTAECDLYDPAIQDKLLDLTEQLETILADSKKSGEPK